MIKRVKPIRVGDVFEVVISPTEKKYMQYIVCDLTMLYSNVVRGFSKIYNIHDKPTLEEIISDNVQFYAHCYLKVGTKMGYWSFYGNIAETGDYSNVLFRDTMDFGCPEIKISNNWHVWHVNEKFKHVGKLTPEYQNSYVGGVFPPISILEYVRDGMFQGAYPRYE